MDETQQILKAIKSNRFDPLSRIKEENKWLALGLAMIKQLVAETNPGNKKGFGLIIQFLV